MSAWKVPSHQFRRLLARLRQPTHMGLFGDLADPFAACWSPDPYEIR